MPRAWDWWAVAAELALLAASGAAIRRWSHRPIDRLALAGGAAMAYALHAFVAIPSLGEPDAVTRLGNAVFAALAAGLIAVGARRTSARMIE